jgi:hypothetical protein
LADKGFQQAGIIIKSDNDSTENYLLLTTGTGGNPAPRLFFKKQPSVEAKQSLTKLPA